jgi:multicomponent Na+:H+ antiporter subunit D
MLVAMFITAVLCILIGVLPQYLYSILPWEMDYWPYDVTHVLAQLQLLCFAALAFIWMEIKRYAPPELHADNLDAEWFYRRLVPAGAQRTLNLMRAAKAATLTTVTAHMQGIKNEFGKSPMAKYHLSESWPTGSMVFWISAILAAFLLLDLLGLEALA